MNKKCFIDLDGVLADFVAGAYRLMNMPVPEDVQWDFMPDWLWPKMDRDFWATLDKTEFCGEILDYAFGQFGPESCAILSSPCCTPGCHEGKIAWVERHVPLLKKQVLLGSAKHFCASPNAWLIDDSDNNVDAFEANGGNAILIPQTWNRKKGKKLVLLLPHEYRGPC